MTEGLWEQALSFLTGELGATRAVVLHEDDPDKDFEVIAGRGIDVNHFWRDANVDFSVLSSVCSSGLPENRRNQMICAPGRDRNGRVVALLYADRPRQPFGAQSMNSMSGFLSVFEQRLQEVHVTRVKTRSRSLSRVGTANTRVAFLLAEQGLLSTDEAEQFVQQSKTQGVILEKLLVDSGRLREEDILLAQARYYGLEPWVANPSGLNPEVTRMLPPEKARELGALPIGYSGDALGVALAMPDNTFALDELRRLSGRNVVVRLVGRLGYQRLLDSLAVAAIEEPATLVSTGSLLAGRYRVDELPLLVCRFSSLLNAVDVETNQPVVLRRLEPPTKDKAQARNQTLSEGRRMSQLRHPNLPFVERVIESEEQIYLVLENFTGPTLEQLVIQHGPVPAQQLPLLADQLMSVFEYLHSQEPPIIHRDLRPEVVILTPDAQIKLAEFGLAKMHADAAGEATSFRAHGSPFYASPEQLLGEPSHPRQDLYSLGAILYYLATGNTPGKSLERCFNQTAPGKVAGLPGGFPEPLENLISRLLEPDGEQRPQSMTEARKLLEPALPPPLPAPSGKGRKIQLEPPLPQASPAVAEPPLPSAEPAAAPAPPADFAAPAYSPVEEPAYSPPAEPAAYSFVAEPPYPPMAEPTPAPAPVAEPASAPGAEPSLEALLLEARAAGVEALHWDPGQPLRRRAHGKLGPAAGGAEGALSELLSRAPQGGPLQIGAVDLWVSVIGDSVVARLAAGRPVTRSLSDLGMPAAVQERLRVLLGRRGILAATGPGHSATLYACLAELRSPERRLIAIERLPEHRLDGVLSLRVKPGHGTEQALEDALAHDPDVVLVSQVSTAEACRGVTQGALAGALMLVGLGASDSLAALPLAGDPGVVLGCLAQRTTRRLCSHCREEAPVAPEQLASFERYQVASPRMFRPRGCSECRDGFQGELGLFELLLVTPEIRHLLAAGAPADELRRTAFAQGFQPWLQDGFQKVAAGMTTLEELQRVSH